MAAADTSGTGGLTYIRGFNGVRALAVLGVVAIHLGWVGKLPRRLQVMAIPAGAPLPVVAFFVLSGFLITTLMLREEARTGRISLRGFYRRRLLRIMPCASVFLLVLGALALSGTITMVWRHYALSWLYLGNAVDYTHYERTLAHTWSLAVEEHFYLLFPLLMVATRRARVVVAVAVVLACTPIRLALLHGDLPDRYPVTRFTLPALDAILLGCVAALCWRLGGGLLPRMLRHPATLAAACLLLCSPAVLIGVSPGWYYLPWLIGVTLLVVSVAARQGSPGVAVLEWYPLRTIGLFSYGIYVWQGLFLRNGPEAPQFWLQRAPWSVAATFAAAAASYLLIERPLLRFKPAGEGQDRPVRTGSVPANR